MVFRPQVATTAVHKTCLQRSNQHWLESEFIYLLLLFVLWGHRFMTLRELHVIVQPWSMLSSKCVCCLWAICVWRRKHACLSSWIFYSYYCNSSPLSCYRLGGCQWLVGAGESRIGVWAHEGSWQEDPGYDGFVIRMRDPQSTAVCWLQFSIMHTVIVIRQQACKANGLTLEEELLRIATSPSQGVRGSRFCTPHQTPTSDSRFDHFSQSLHGKIVIKFTHMIYVPNASRDSHNAPSSHLTCIERQSNFNLDYKKV